MCRMLGMISEKPSNASYYFFDADIPFASLSKSNRHGWGRGYIGKDGKVDIFKQGQDDVPIEKYDFQRMRGINSKYIITHVRKTRKQDHRTVNAQPFEYKFEDNDWIFAHNGGVEREPLLSQLTDEFKSMIRGNADSEVYGLHIMQNFKNCGDMPTAIRDTLKVINGDYESLNFLMTDGERMYGYRDAKVKKSYFTLYYTTPGHNKDSRSVVFSSRKLTEDEKWTLVKQGQLVIADSNLKIEKIMLGE